MSLERSKDDPLLRSTMLKGSQEKQRMAIGPGARRQNKAHTREKIEAIRTLLRGT